MTTSEIAKKLGQRGGLKRAQRLSGERRKEIAKLGAQARMESLRLAKLIRTNFNYVTAIRKLQSAKNV